MTDARRLDPCSYSPSGDYAQIFSDPAYQQFNSKSNYDSGSKRRFEIYFDRVDEAKKACFLNVIESKLTGKTPQPAAARPASAEPAPAVNPRKRASGAATGK